MLRTLFILGVFAMIHSAATAAETDCDRSFWGQRYCLTGIMSNDFEEQVAETDASQERPFWCWAASVSMVFKWHGYDISQKELVRKTFGDGRVNLPARGSQISNLLKSEYTDARGHKFGVSSSAFDLESGRFNVGVGDIVKALEEERPLIVGANGHAVVMTAVIYERAPNGTPVRIVGGIVRDPWPGMGKRELRVEELSPIYVADIKIRHRDRCNPLVEDRIYRCQDSCAIQSQSCINAVRGDLNQCSDQCDQNICDRCNIRQMPYNVWEQCRDRCESCQNKCSILQDSGHDSCEQRTETCQTNCGTTCPR